jgi:hypothetical protein
VLQRYIDVSVIPIEYGGECEVVLPYPLNNLTGEEREEKNIEGREGREERGEERKREREKERERGGVR